MNKLLLVIIIVLVGNAHAQTYQNNNSTNKRSSVDQNLRTKYPNEIQRAFEKSGIKENVLSFNYNPYFTYKIRAREFMNTNIILPEYDSIKGISLGDQNNFSVKPLTKAGLKNYLVLVPKNAGVDTNLVVFGESGNVYNFYIKVDTVNSTHMPIFTVFINDNYNDNKNTKSLINSSTEIEGEYLDSIPKAEHTVKNFSYEYSNLGNLTTVPLDVYDDGYWTYIKLSEDNNLNKIGDLPVLYRVNEGVDEPINTRVSGGFLIAETTASGWSLKSGGRYLCIRKKNNEQS